MTTRAVPLRDAERGFSLIEALVALLILAIASVGLIRAVESHIDSTRAMELRATAMWVAQDRLAELRVRDPAANRGTVSMLDQQWRVSVHDTGTGDPDIAKVHIDVYGAGSTAALASLDGFIDTGARDSKT